MMPVRQIETPVRASNPPAPRVFHAGSLVYTKATMLTLMGWLLWGDFVFNFMEIVIGSLLPLKIKGMDAPDWFIGMALTTIPSFLGMALGPVYAVASDRTRTRFGRRIPYLLVTTPVVTILLVMIGFSDKIGHWLHGVFALTSSPHVTLLVVAAVLIGAFSLLNGFMTGAYYNLLNDVVPPEVLARFLAVFRIVGVIATSAFQFYLFGFAKSHMVELIVGSAVLYGVMFMAMSLAVKEGTYPPPAPREVKSEGFWVSHVKSYIRECFSHRVYWYFFLASLFWNMSFVVYSFRVFFAQSVGLDLGTFGKLMGVAGIVSAVLLYPAGALGDRWHPMRTMILGMALLAVAVPCQLVFAFFSLPPAWEPGIYMGLFVLHISVQSVVRASEMPLQMRLLPHDRYAQLGSAAGIIISLGIMAAGVISGVWLEWMKARETVELFHYRYLPAWSALCILISLGFFLLLYREWKRLGGDQHYTAP